MSSERKQNRRFSLVATLLFALSLVASCSGTATPAPAQTAMPTSKPTPVFTLSLEQRQVPVGQSVAIVARVEPLEKLNLKWSVSGTSGGKLNTDTGEQVVYTAGKEGVDTVVAEGTTVSGVPVKQTVTLTVRGVPTVPLETPTTVIQLPPIATPLPSGVTLTTPQDGQKVPCENIARGTYPLDLKEHIWPIVYIAGRFHPQDEGGRAAQKVGGNWYQTVRFGDCGRTPSPDVGRPFQLTIVTANEFANTEFEKYIKSGQASGSWPGFMELPSGTKEHTRITVIRQ